MLRGADQVKILTLDLVHHGVHLVKTHNAGDHIGTDHKGRYTVGETAVDHKVSGIGDHGRMQSGDIAHQIVETVSRNLSGGFQIDPVKPLHDLRMIRDLKVRCHGISEFLDFHITAVVLSDGHRRINDVRDRHHALFDLFRKGSLLFFKFGQSICIGIHLCLYRLRLLFLSLLHQCTDLLGKCISGVSQFVPLLLYGTHFLVQFDHFIHQRKLVILKLFLDVFLYRIRIFTDEFDV